MAQYQSYGYVGGASGSFSNPDDWKNGEDSKPGTPGAGDNADVDSSKGAVTLTGSATLNSFSAGDITLVGGTMNIVSHDGSFGTFAASHITLQNYVLSGDDGAGNLYANVMQSSEIHSQHASGTEMMVSSHITATSFNSVSLEMDQQSTIVGHKDKAAQIAFITGAATIAGSVGGFSYMTFLSNLDLTGTINGGDLRLNGGGNTLSGKITLSDIASTTGIEGSLKNYGPTDISGSVTAYTLYNESILRIKGSMHLMDENVGFSAVQDSSITVSGSFVEDKAFEAYGRLSAAGGMIKALDLTVHGTLNASSGGKIIVKDLLDLGSAGDKIVVKLSGGAKLTAKEIEVHEQPVGYPINSATITLTGDGTEITATRTFNLGVNSLGTLSVSAGADVTTAKLEIGGKAGGNGEAIFSGTGTTLTVDEATILGAGKALGTRAAGSGAIEVREHAKVVSHAVTLGQDKGTSGSIEINASNWQLSGDLIVGNQGRGRLDLSNGAHIKFENSDIRVGVSAGSYGILDITGARTSLESDQDTLRIGEKGKGELVVSHDATLDIHSLQLGQTKGASGTVTVSGANTELVSKLTPFIGDAGRASIIVEDSASVTLGGGATNQILVGKSVGGAGTIEISDKGSELELGRQTLVLGVAGKGALEVTNGAHFTASEIDLAQMSGSSGEIDVQGAGTEFHVGHMHAIGEAGKALVLVKEGAKFVVDQPNKVFSIGFTAGKGEAFGRFSISDRQTVVDLDAIQINVGDGKGASGEIDLSADARFDAGKFVVGNQQSSSGVANISGGAVLTADALTVGEHGQGTFKVTDSARITVAASKEGAEIAASTGSVGGVVIDSGSKLSLGSNDLSVGGTLTSAGGTAQLTVSNSGTVTMGDRLVMWSHGTIDVSGGGRLAMSGTTAKANTVSIGTGDTLVGAGHVHGNVLNTGMIEAKGGILSLMDGKLSGTGQLKIDAGATLDISHLTANATIARLSDSGKLVLGSHDVVVTDRYTNANWGVGDKFNAHAGMSGSGDIIGQGASLEVASGGHASSSALTVHFLKTSGKYIATFTLENSGSGADITAALQTAALGKGISGVGSSNLTLGEGDAHTFHLVYDPSSGPLTGKHLTIASNFDNIDDLTLSFDVGKASAGNGVDAAGGDANHSAIIEGATGSAHYDTLFPATVGNQDYLM